RKAPILAADLEGHGAGGGVGELLLLEAAEKIERLCNARLKLGECLFFIGKARHRNAGKPCPRSFGKIAGKLHLSPQRKHVGEQPCRKERVRIDLFRLAIRFSLLEDGRERTEELRKHGD